MKRRAFAFFMMLIGHFMWAQQINCVWNTRNQIHGQEWDPFVFDRDSSMVTMDTHIGQDRFVMRQYNDDSIIWKKKIPADASGIALHIDKSGNIYYGGTFQPFSKDHVVFGENTKLKTNGYDDAFVAKLDRYGNLKWVRHFGGNEWDWLSSITTDSKNNVYMCGNFSREGDFDPGPGVFKLRNDEVSLFIVKLDSLGNFNWARTVAGSGSAFNGELAMGDGDALYAGGQFKGKISFDNCKKNLYLNSVIDPSINYSILHPPETDFFICRISTDGCFQWAKSIGGTETDYLLGISADSSGVYSYGIFKGKVDFDPGPGTFEMNSEFRRYYVNKLAPTGKHIWAKELNFWPGISYSIDASGNMKKSDFRPEKEPCEHFGRIDLKTRENFVLKISHCENFHPHD